MAMMNHLLVPAVPSTAKPVPLISRKTTPLVWAYSRGFDEVPEEKQVRRRGVLLGLTGVALVMNGGARDARGAAKRPPPRPPQEKKDPNVSGLTAKILASKKRKEAMKESIAKLKESGKPIKEPSE
ncbi:uncharacterized protein LOC111393576 [Olea europaea var. sylvestris]|uniref:uncharacterized protein LOC111393576 n=1 Tax=Olea europaea var. sylvestris TaxID=158386 RepID=UPI000C1D88BA|nr:uncharacterized protein LOC111393576 [Olea europaea var. sylvestris]